ncbi:MAG: hypothetical protein ACYC26_12275 [Phycisphaerales bacterium]
MNFWDTPLRRSRMLHAIYFFVIAAALLAMIFLVEGDDFGKVLIGGMIAFFLLMGLFLVWLARRTPADVVVTSNPERLPLPERIAYYKKILWSGTIGFLALTAFVVNDLNQLESGAVKEVRIWEPLALLYEHCGYWPTVLFLPTVCLICTVVIWRKLRRAEAKLRGEG